MANFLGLYVKIASSRFDLKHLCSKELGGLISREFGDQLNHEFKCQRIRVFRNMYVCINKYILSIH